MYQYDARQLADSLRTVRKNTIQVADDIPESQYQYRPTPESRSVAELLVHIAWLASADRFFHEDEHCESVEAFDFGALIGKTVAEEKILRSKAEIIDLLRTGGERYVQWVEQLPEAFLSERVAWPGGGSKNRFEMLIGTKEHEMQHRAQLTVIERLIGLVPHFTRNLQASLDAAARQPEMASVG